MARPITTDIRIYDYCFHIGKAEEDGLMDFLMEEKDYDVEKHEEFIGNYCLATLTPEEVEYIAKRMLDAVEYMRRQDRKEAAQ